MKGYLSHGLLLAASIAIGWQSIDSGTNEVAPGADSIGVNSVLYGRYLVHDVAMCVQCHTPRSADGELLRDELLQGAKLPVAAPDDGAWALRAPSIAGLPGGWSEEQLASFLHTGKTPAGRTARRPMPPYRLKVHDAAAVAAYLVSLGDSK